MRIERRSYSRQPWRLVTESGTEVAAPVPFEHPSIGWTVIVEPICGATKSECTDKALALLDRLLARG